jgi:hypothetical protein
MSVQREQPLLLRIYAPDGAAAGETPEVPVKALSVSETRGSSHAYNEADDERLAGYMRSFAVVDRHGHLSHHFLFRSGHPGYRDLFLAEADFFN